MSRSHHNGHGRCGVCGDAGAARRARERARLPNLSDEHAEYSSTVARRVDEPLGSTWLDYTD